MYEDVANDVKEKGYAAVSHVWGNQKMYSADELGINSGVEWEVPLSDPNKIRRLVNAMNRYKMEYCWFDVLCMPQNRQNEINEEIPFMGDYYNGAEMTFVLLTTNYVASESLAIWSSFMTDVIKDERDFTVEENKWFTYNRNILDMSGEVWFTRVWTLQEAILSNKIVLSGLDGSHLNLSDILDRIRCLEAINSTYSLLLFSKSHNLLPLSRAVKDRKTGEVTSTEALSYNMERECHKIHDRFYGVLGILGYKDFVIDYEMGIEDLNKNFAKYAYSKGDISWMSIGGNIGNGFVQPMYKGFNNIGIGWKETWPGSSGIVFDDRTLTMDVNLLGNVIYKANFAETGLKSDKFIGWCVRTFREWKFDDDDICSAMEGFRIYPSTNRQVAKVYLDGLSKNMELDEMGMEMARLFGADTATKNMFAMFSIMSDTNLLFRNATIMGIISDVAAKKIALIVCGNADVGDRVVFTKVADKGMRFLSIVTSNSDRRKGVCLYGAKEACGFLGISKQISHKFPLF